MSDEPVNESPDIENPPHEQTDDLSYRKPTPKELKIMEQEKKKELKRLNEAKKKKEILRKKEEKNKIKLEKQKIIEEKEAEERKYLFTEQDKLSRLEKYDEEDKNDSDNVQFIADEGFRGPQPTRVITDKYWIPLFIFLNLGLIVTAYFAIADGDLSRLINGMDFRGVICGVGSYSDKPFLYFINPVLDINVGICVSSCPKSTGNSICLYEKDGFTKTGFCYTQMQTSYSGRYCLPLEPINKEIVDNHLNEFFHLVKRTSADFLAAKEFIGIGIIIAVITPLIVLFLLKHQKSVAIISWGSIFGSFIVLAGFGYMFYTEYQIQKEKICPFTSSNACTGWKTSFYYYFFCFICVMGGLYLIIIIKLFGRIGLAIGILKAASQTTEVLTQLRIIPLFMTIIGLSFVGFTLIVALKSFSCGEIMIIAANNIDGSRVKKIYWAAYIQWLIIYNCFMLFYWLLVILGYSDLITSYALCIWFFVKNKTTVNIPVKRSFRDITKYHMGTLFFGSIAFVILGIPKICMQFFTKILRKAKQHSDFIRFTSASCMCCIHVYQKLLRYISMNAYVQTSLWGSNYYHSAKKAYFLLFRNANLTKDLDFLQAFLIFQTKLCVALISSGTVYILLNFFDRSFLLEDDLTILESPFAPTILVFFIGFFLSSIIQGSFNITCKTIIQCYLIDCEMFIGEQRYAEEFIRKFMDFFSKGSNMKIWVQTQKNEKHSLNTTNQKEDNLSDKNEDSFEKDEKNVKPMESVKEKNNESDEEEESESEEESKGDSKVSEGSHDGSENSETTNKNERFVHDASEEHVDFYDNNPQKNEIPKIEENERIDTENSKNSSRLFKKKLEKPGDENMPFVLPKDNNDEWNLMNASYDQIKNKVFEVLDKPEEIQQEIINKNSFNYFDKSKNSDSTWKFEDPFDMPKKNYRAF